jgi:predicted DNA binding protein
VAAELDLDASTVVEHLQRAERNLMAHHLEGA